MIGRRKLAGSSGGNAAALIVDPRAQLLGYELITFDPDLVGAKLNISNQLFVACLVYAPRAATLTTLGLVVETASANMVADTKMGIYTEAGVLLASTGDMSAQFATTGAKEAALTASQAVTAGTRYYLGLVGNTSAAVPAICGAITDGGGAINLVVVNGHRRSVFVSAQATLPASFNPATATVNSGAYLFLAR